MKCDKCSFANDDNLKYCGNCGNKLDKPLLQQDFLDELSKSEAESKKKIEVEELEKEAKSQLAGLKILTTIGTIGGVIIWFWALITYSISISVSRDPTEGVGMFLTLLLFAGFTYLNLMGLMGLLRRKAYAIPICRAILWVNGALIILIVLWPRLNKPLVKWYLNYGSVDIKEAEKEVALINKKTFYV